MSEQIARVGDVGHNQGSCKGIRDGGNCKWKSTRGERGEEQLMAAVGREEQSGTGRKQGRRAGIFQGTAGAGRVRRVCWEMPWKVYIPRCLFTWRKFPAGYVQGQAAGDRKDRMPTQYTGSELPLPTLKSKRGPIHADVSPGRLLSASSSFAKTSLE